MATTEGARPLDELDAVDWSGPPETAEHVRALADEDDGARAGAYEFFYGQLLQPGTGSSGAAAQAAPFLIGLVADVTVPQRSHLLELLDSLSAVAAEGGALAQALAAGAPAYAALLQDEDDEVRLQATQLTSRWPGPTGAAAAALRERAERDGDERVRANALLALAVLGAPDRALAEKSFGAGGDHALERLAGAVSLVSQLKGDAPAEVFEHLLSAVSGDPDAVEAAEVLPALGDPWGTVAGALGRAPEPLRERALAALVESFDARAWATDEQSAGLLRAALGGSGKATPEQLESLSPLQKDAVRAVAEKAAAGTGVSASILVAMKELGLPTEPAELAKLLGTPAAPGGSSTPDQKPWWKIW